MTRIASETSPTLTTGTDLLTGVGTPTLDIKVEIAFATDPDAPLPAWQDVTAYALGVSIRRGRQYELDQIQASTCDLRLANGDRRFECESAGKNAEPVQYALLCLAEQVIAPLQCRV